MSAKLEDVDMLGFEDLLRRIGEELTLSEAKREQAVARYEAVGSWLIAEGSRIARWKPEIYAQGSLRIGTTVRPRGRNEFDLDLVCEFKAPDPRMTNPITMLNALEERLLESEQYAPMIERKSRCIRLDYANDFHLDILPARPDLISEIPEAVDVPDRDARAWKPSNPNGYARWFEACSRKSVQKGMAPFPGVVEPMPLVVMVQLFKRWRDLKFEGEREVAISIVLTTLAGLHYDGDFTLRSGFATVLRAIEKEIEKQALWMRRLVVPNPANPKEDLSERWDDAKLYSQFVKGFADLKRKWDRLVDQRGISEVERLLSDLFGEDVVQRALRKQGEALQARRERSAIGVTRAGGLATGASTLPIRRNTFFGD